MNHYLTKDEFIAIAVNQRLIMSVKVSIAKIFMMTKLIFMK